MNSQCSTLWVSGGRCAEHMSHIQPPLYDGGCPSIRARRWPWGQRREGGGGPAGFCSQGGKRESMECCSSGAVAFAVISFWTFGRQLAAQRVTWLAAAAAAGGGSLKRETHRASLNTKRLQNNMRGEKGGLDDGGKFLSCVNDTAA